MTRSACCGGGSSEAGTRPEQAMEYVLKRILPSGIEGALHKADKYRELNTSRPRRRASAATSSPSIPTTRLRSARSGSP